MSYTYVIDILSAERCYDDATLKVVDSGLILLTERRLRDADRHDDIMSAATLASR